MPPIGRPGDAAAVGRDSRFREVERALSLMHVVPIFGVLNGQDGRLVCECGRVDCRRPGKHPRFRNWRSSGTRDAEQLRKWCDTWPNANFAGLTGEVIVLDLDDKRRPDGTVDCGSVMLQILEDYHGEPIPHTVMAHSGGGEHRRHLYFRSPECSHVGCHTDLFPGADIKGVGGYVILPQSKHHSGRMYTWAPECAPDEVPIASPPRWLVDMLRDAEARRTQRVQGNPTPIYELDALLREHGIDLRSIRLNPNATPPAWRLRQLLSRRKHNHGRILATWQLRRGPGTPYALSDCSTSGYELALASVAGCNKWPAQDIVDLLVYWRRLHGLDPARMHRGRVVATLRKALARVLGRIRQKRGRKPSPARQEILRLRAEHPGMSNREIATELGISVGAVKMLLLRTRRER